MRRRWNTRCTGVGCLTCADTPTAPGASMPGPGAACSTTLWLTPNCSPLFTDPGWTSRGSVQRVPRPESLSAAGMRRLGVRCLSSRSLAITLRASAPRTTGPSVTGWSASFSRVLPLGDATGDALGDTTGDGPGKLTTRDGVTAMRHRSARSRTASMGCAPGRRGGKSGLVVRA